MTIRLITALILAGYLWTDAAVAQSTDDQDLMPEFCVATFLVTGNAAEADIWLNRYLLKREYIAYMQLNIELLLKEGEIRGEDIIAASDGCKDAHLGAEEQDDGRE